MTTPTPGPIPGPSASPSTDLPPDRIARLASYFRANRTFTAEGLTRAATEAGYSMAEIEAAWSAVGWGSAEEAVDRGFGMGISAVVAIVLAIGVMVAWWVLASNSETSMFAWPAVGLLLLAGIVAWWFLRVSHPSLALGIGCGVVVAVAVPALLYLAILGICYAMGFNR